MLDSISYLQMICLYRYEHNSILSHFKDLSIPAV